MHVLVIDDEPSFLRVVQRTMGATHHVETADSACVAFTKLAAQRFDVIMCDVHMPGIGGRAFVESLSPLDAARVLFTTGGTCGAGADDDFFANHRVLMKPFTMGELTAAMNAVVHDAA